ncbi:hypothetical protein [Rhizobium sp. Leaf383]|uniref:hypothetical protein n=1 Tax=Rhizobium sp. Leaf383 TaxID=1736357 RepID=UPI000712FFEC|nr:hypothetical protein [Rhizobium sp. Leaf383]KQS86950.1 hypothetical protein ASG58_01505 [Rhizobium sp. Leaf383]
MATANVDAGEVMSGLTLTFTLTRTYRARIWLGARLILFAGLVLGTSMVVVEVDAALDES